MITALIIIMVPFLILFVVFLFQIIVSPEGYEDKTGFHRINHNKKAKTILASRETRGFAPSYERNPSKPRLS